MSPTADDTGLLRRLHEALAGYLAVGHVTDESRGVLFVRSETLPDVYDANFAYALGAVGAGEVDWLLAEMDQRFGGQRHRKIHAGTGLTPDGEARLVVEGFGPDDGVELLLEGELEATPPPIDIRRAADDEDWAVIGRLTRLDHEEQAVREQRAPYRPEVTDQLVATRRAKEPALRTWMARADGVDCGCFSSWPGENGIGKVEDLFTHPDFRRRGIGTALIDRAVRDARARGAESVVIGARPDDWPKRLYARLGFRPVCVSRGYLRRAEPAG